MTDQTCVWVDQDSHWYESACNNAFVFNDDGPTENGFKFCPYCGLPLVEQRSEDNDDD